MPIGNRNCAGYGCNHCGSSVKPTLPARFPGASSCTKEAPCFVRGVSNHGNANSPHYLIIRVRDSSSLFAIGKNRVLIQGPAAKPELTRPRAGPGGDPAHRRSGWAHVNGGLAAGPKNLFERAFRSLYRGILLCASRAFTIARMSSSFKPAWEHALIISSISSSTGLSVARAAPTSFLSATNVPRPFLVVM